MLSLVFTSSCSLPPPPSTSPSSLLSHCLPLLLLQSSHRHHSDHWVLVEFTLAVHQAICLGSLNPHPLVHLPCHRGMERLKHFHGKFDISVSGCCNPVQPPLMCLYCPCQGQAATSTCIGKLDKIFINTID